MKLALSGLAGLLTCCVVSANPYLPAGCQSCGPNLQHCQPFPLYAPNPYCIPNQNYWFGPGGLPFNGILPPPPWAQQQQQMQGPAFSTHPYARSPRDFFMISDIQEDLNRRRY